jgi:hypothetical protein
MPVTDRVTVCVAAQAGALNAAERASTVMSLFMGVLSVKQRQNVGEREREPRQCGHD